MGQLGLFSFKLKAPQKNVLKHFKGIVNWDCLGTSVVDHLLKIVFAKWGNLWIISILLKKET